MELHNTLKYSPIRLHKISKMKPPAAILGAKPGFLFFDNELRALKCLTRAFISNLLMFWGFLVGLEVFVQIEGGKPAQSTDSIQTELKWEKAKKNAEKNEMNR